MLKEGNCPSESFASILKMARLCGIIVGMDVASPNLRLNWINGIVICSIIGYFIFSITTIVAMFEENPTFVLEASCMLGSVLQGITKLISGFMYTKNLVELRYELEDLYKEYEQKGSEYTVVLNKSCKRVRKVIKLFGLIYLYAMTGVICVPIVLYVATKRRYLMMHFLIPGLDVETNFGYLLTTAAHAICLYAGTFGLYAGDLFIVIYLLQSLLFADIFKLKIQELNTEDAKNAHKQRLMLRDIIKWHKKYNDFTTCCNNIMYYTITVQITTAGISILCTLFILIAGEWPGAYAYILLPIFGLYSYCMLGTKIEVCVSNERFSCEIYDINWFMLPRSEQELVNIMLIKSQSPATIDVAGVMPLSVGTALQITKTIYSIFMMMVQMLVK